MFYAKALIALFKLNLFQKMCYKALIEAFF